MTADLRADLCAALCAPADLFDVPVPDLLLAAAVQALVLVQWVGCRAGGVLRR